VEVSLRGVCATTLMLICVWCGSLVLTIDGLLVLMA